MWLKKLFFWSVVALSMSACVQQTTTNPYDKDSSAIKQARAHTELGAAYLKEGKLAIALEEFNIAIEIAPDYALAYNGLGMVQAALGELTKADAAYKKAIALEPNNSESHNNYGNFLCNNGRYDESITHFLAAIKNPLYVTPHIAYTNAGICSNRKKDIVNAEQYFIKALQIEPLNPVAAYQLANIQFDRGDALGAQRTLQNVIVSSPNPELLWLGVKIERQLGNKDNEASYAIQLRKLFPNSRETQLLINGQP